MKRAIMELPVHTPTSHTEPLKRPARLVFAILPPGDRSADGAAGSAEGYVLHVGEPQEMLAAIHALIDGAAPRPERPAGKVLLRIVPDPVPYVKLFGLSPRETEVLQGMVDGLSYKMVAERLGISFETVRTHVKKVYDKLGVHNCTEAVAKALKSGLLV